VTVVVPVGAEHCAFSSNRENLPDTFALDDVARLDGLARVSRARRHLVRADDPCVGYHGRSPSVRIATASSRTSVWRRMRRSMLSWRLSESIEADGATRMDQLALLVVALDR
jgi:hypothetical protein